MDLKEIEKKLKAPFRPEELEFRIITQTKDKTKGLVAAYIQNRAVQNRLDETVGFENWKNEFIVTGNAKICGLSIRINNEWITKYDGASDTDIEATKGGLSNAMKRAAVEWGIGRYLYKLPSQWVKIEPSGKSYKITELPKLPNWALPDDMKQKQPDFKEINKGLKPKKENKLDSDIEACIKAFKGLGVSKEQLESYLCLEADMFTKTDIDTLRNIYSQIYFKKNTIDDFFRPIEKEQRGQQTLKLEETLTKGE